MAHRNAITVDHINDFFSLNPRLESLKIAPSVTGGLGIDNLAQFPPPEPEQPRTKKGYDYVKEALENDLDEIPPAYDDDGGVGRGFNALDELSTTVDEMSMLSDLQSEAARQFYSCYFKENVEYNNSLSIRKFKDQILQLINISQVVVIQGPTGCGKTTQVPQYILDHHANAGQHCNIIVTQPRKIAAISIARRVCEERDWNLSTVVGYQVGMDNKTSVDTRISYVTTGVFLQKLINARRMDMYTHVIIDEVHERDIETDFVLLIVKKLLRTNSKMVKVILMSATIDASLFANYFSHGRGDPAPIIDVEGKRLQVTEHYLKELTLLDVPLPELDAATPFIPEELYDIAVKLIAAFDRIEKQEQNVSSHVDFAPIRGTVLIFLPGFEEINTMMVKVGKNAESRKYSILPLHSSVTVEEQSRVFRPSTHGFRKVIISTNIAESSITVPDIKYVIDFCLTKNSVCDPYTNYVCLKLEYASKSQCTQRKGRAGRVNIGRVYRLVPKEFYEENLDEHGVPDMKRSPLTQTVLFAKKLNFGSPRSLLGFAIDPPDLADIENAILVLKEVGALTSTVNNVPSIDDGDLTFTGRVMASLPVDVRISRLVLLGHVFDCLEQCLIIAASLSLKNFISKPFTARLEAYKSVFSWSAGTFSDCFVYFNAYNVWKRLSTQGQFNRPGGQSEKEWAKQNFVQLKRIKEVDELVKELKSRLEVFNIRVNYRRHNIDEDSVWALLLRVVIAGAFYPNYYVQDELDETEVLRSVNNSDPYTTVHISGLPPNHGILYFETIQRMMSHCSSRMSIEFEERKAYIKFDEILREEERANAFPIPASVFYAVKMRTLRMLPELNVFSFDDAERKMQQLRRLHEDPDKTKLTSKRMNVQLSNTTIKQVELPNMNEGSIHLFISHVIDSGHFWARYANEMTELRLSFLNKVYKTGNLLQPITQEVHPGMLVLAPYDTNSNYYRATVQDISHNGVLVFYVDFGNTMIVKRNDLRQIGQNLDNSDIPALAFECQLSEVKPSSIASPSGKWTKVAIDYFRSVVSGRTLKAKVYSVVQNIVRLELLDLDKHNRIYSINLELRSRGFAELAEESYLSKQNHLQRIECEDHGIMKPAEINSQAIQFTARELQKETQGHTTSRKIVLHGPFSPLEASYKGVTYIDRSKSIKIDRDSVNSVSFNLEPQDKHSQFLVASSVSLNQRSDSVNARSTTLMPKILGLQHLLSMVFAPSVELRTDEERKEYIGAICGLGYDESTGRSLYRDHDIELSFDCAINDTDILEINAVRMGINLALGKNEISECGENFSSLQSKVRQAMLGIIKRKRLPKEPVYFNRNYKWMQVPSEYVLSTALEDEILYSPLLPLIKGISLSTKPLITQFKDHRRELYNKASDSVKQESINCNFCSMTLRNPRELLFHLESLEHRKLENQFLK